MFAEDSSTEAPSLPSVRTQWQQQQSSSLISESPYPPTGFILGMVVAVLAFLVSPIMANARRNAIELVLGSAWVLINLWEGLEQKLYRLITWN